MASLLNYSRLLSVNSFHFCNVSVLSPTTSTLFNGFNCGKNLHLHVITTRSTSFFNKLPAESLWKGVTSVSNAGRKRGRGKGTGKKIAKDLNKGQMIGVGKINMVWPGLNIPVMKGRELIEQQQLPDDPERENKLLKLRNEIGGFKRLKLLPIERGWTGTKFPGRSIGPPDPIGEDAFEGFDTKVLEMKSVFNMTGNMGRKRQMSVFVVTGNKQGLAGFGLGKAIEGRTAMKTAKNRAGQKLMSIPMYNNYTVCHDFMTQFGRTKILVRKKPEGYGLICHRAIRSMCEIIGIKDLYAKVEGPTNIQHIAKAFFLGLIKQKEPEQLVEETKLHLVELKKERDYYPELIASPTTCLEKTSDYPDFSQYVLGGNVIYQKKRFPPFYKRGPGWITHLKKTLWRRNHDEVKIQLRAEYGHVHSFLTEKYPECKVKKCKKSEDK